MIERLLLASGLAAGLARQRRGQRLILAYHNITPAGAEPVGDRSLHLPLARFEEQLEILSMTCNIRPLAEVLAESGDRSGPPTVAITFDDAYLGAIQVGIRALQRRGLPATIFVAPGFLGGASYWWDAVADPLTEGLAPAHRAAALQRCRGRDPEVRSWAQSVGLPLREPPVWMRTASESDLLAVASLPGITLGSHTWGHPNLTRLAPDELSDELTRPRVWLEERGLGGLQALSYPYGLADARVERAAADAGYRWGLNVTGGWMRSHSPPFAIPRLNVPAGLSQEGLRLRLAGVWAE